MFEALEKINERPKAFEFYTATEYTWLQYFMPEDLEKEFSAAGISVKRLYSDVAGTPYDRDSNEFAVIADRVGMRLMFLHGLMHHIELCAGEVACDGERRTQQGVVHGWASHPTCGR